MKTKIRDTRRKEFFTIDNEIINYLEEITPTGATIYLVLCKSADEKQECFPSQDYISKVTGIKKRETISKYLQKLEKCNIIKIDKTKDKDTGKWLHNTYTLIDKTEWISTPRQTGHGIHDPLKGTWPEAKSMPRQTDTNNTHVLTKPIVGKNPIVNNPEKFIDSLSLKGGISPELKERLEKKAARKEKKSMFNTAAKKKYKKDSSDSWRRGAHGEGII